MRKELLLTAVVLASVGLASAQMAPGAQHQQSAQPPAGEMRQGAQNQGKQNQTQTQQLQRDQTTGQGQAGQTPKQPDGLNQSQTTQPKASQRSQTTGQGTKEHSQTTGQGMGERNQPTGQAQQPHVQSPQTQGQSLRNQNEPGQAKPRQAQPSQPSQPSQAQSRQGSATQVQQTQANGTVNLTAEQRTKVQQTVLASRDVPRVDHVNFSIVVGTVVPTSVRIVEVPETLIEIHPDWRGQMYFVVRDEIIIVDHSHRIIAIVPVGSSSAQLGISERSAMAAGSMTMSVEEIRQVQITLNQKGFNVGEPDGVLGPRTRQALIAFQRQQGFQASGQLDSRTMTALGISSTQQQGAQGRPSTLGSQPSSPSPSMAAPSTGTPSTAVPSTAGQGGNTLQQPPATGSGATQRTPGPAPHPQSMSPNTGTPAPTTSSPSR
jgi:Putative peptidoglycan binding domain/Protein of unknown function (DUF1236)